MGRFWQKQKRTGLGLEQLSFTVFLGGTFWRDVLWGFRKVTIFQETCFWVGFTMPKGRGCELPQLRKRLSGGAVNSPDTVSKSLSATNNRFNLSMKRASQCGAASSHTVSIHAYMHVCIHAYMHICMYAYMHTCMYAYMHTCMHTCMYAYMHICIHACMHTCMYVCLSAS